MTVAVFNETLAMCIDADLSAERAGKELPEHVFSEAFERRMDEFFANRRKEREAAPAAWEPPAVEKRKPRGIKAKYWLIAAAAVLLAFAAVACAVPEIRESVAGFFIRVFGDHFDYEPEISQEGIGRVYGFTEAPEGFFVDVSVREGNMIVTTYSDPSGAYIKLCQAARGFSGESVNREGCSLLEREIGGRSVTLLLGEEFSHAAWVEDGYYFSISCSPGFDESDIESWILSLGAD